MALYNTVPAEESTLLAPPKTTTTKSWKGLVVVAAVASFALGAVAATASSTRAATSTSLDSSGCTDWDSCFANGQCDMKGDKDAPAQCWCSGDNSGGYADLATCLKFYQGIREKKGYTDKFTIQLKKGHYWLGEQYKIPARTWIIGASPTDTMITASNKVSIDCTSSNPGEGRIGFLLGDETYVAHLGYVALDDWRFQMGSAGLCGGFVFEAPGCATSDCGKSKSTDILSYEGNDFISHARVEDIFITGQDKKDKGDINSICWWNNWATDDCKTMPQGSVYIPMSRSRKGTNDVTITGITQLKSLADGLNLHGSAYDILVEGNVLWYPGDDNVGIWSAPKASNGLSSITIKGNDLSQVRTTNTKDYGGNDPNWGSVLGVYGYKDKLLFQDNVVRGRYNTKQGDYTTHGALTFSELFDGKFAQDAHITIAGTKFAGDDTSLMPPPPQPENFGTPDFTIFNMCSARGQFPKEAYDLMVFDKAIVGGAKINNCPMATGGLWKAENDDSVYGCPDASYILPGTCGCDSCYIGWDDNGKNGYGWYCYDSNGLVTSDGSKVTQWEPDMYKTGKKTWKNYDDACIHIKCGRVTYNSWDKMWVCVDDMPGAAALNLNDLAILAREAGHLKTSNYDGVLFDDKKGGNFWYDSGKNQLCWDSKLGASGTVCYDYDYEGLKPDFKMYQQGNPNYYKVFIDPGSNSLQFYCLVGGTTGKFASDC